ncbi:hypothetical protein B0O80DRAFT_485575 [Mortierella sp. GBAus27b]|nr:hypothetical protein B0O80DRAFT_485575 [Mortierella sp. GBAus27b]
MATMVEQVARALIRPTWGTRVGRCVCGEVVRHKGVMDVLNNGMRYHFETDESLTSSISIFHVIDPVTVKVPKFPCSHKHLRLEYPSLSGPRLQLISVPTVHQCYRIEHSIVWRSIEDLLRLQCIAQHEGLHTPPLATLTVPKGLNSCAPVCHSATKPCPCFSLGLGFEP